jgi:hypothetical protein
MAIIVLRHCIRLTYGALPDDWIVENQDDNSRYISVSSQHVGPPQGGDSGDGVAAVVEVFVVVSNRL